MVRVAREFSRPPRRPAAFLSGPNSQATTRRIIASLGPAGCLPADPRFALPRAVSGKPSRQFWSSIQCAYRVRRPARHGVVMRTRSHAVGRCRRAAIGWTLVIDGRARALVRHAAVQPGAGRPEPRARGCTARPSASTSPRFPSRLEGIDTAQTLIANNRSHQIESLFAERDPRRGGGSDISYLVDQSDGAALAFANPTGNAAVMLANAVTEPIVDRGMPRWQNSPSCGGPLVTKLADNGNDPDIVDGLVTGTRPCSARRRPTSPTQAGCRQTSSPCSARAARRASSASPSP